MRSSSASPRSPRSMARCAAGSRPGRGALVETLRANRAREGGIDSFMQEYELSSREGVVLMCLAEALLRIPDDETADRLIRDKIAAADWESHLGHSDSLFVNASTWALMLTGRVIELGDFRGETVGATLGRLLSQSGEPVIRRAVRQAMRILGRQFVLGRTIDEALDRAKAAEAQGYRYSFDMLGEAAHTASDARHYYEAYDAAITAIGRVARGGNEHERASISVKLSALHPRYEFAQAGRAVPELAALLAALAIHAREAGIGLTVDAEEADRLDMHLDILERVSGDERLAGWGGFGIAVQAYQKRALPVIDWLADLARSHGRRLNVRLVKGAYWDTEIKLAQVEGLDGYPVFTRKASTDVSYIACARRLFEVADAIYPQFATHNAPHPRHGAGARRREPGARVPTPSWHGRCALRSNRRGGRGGGHPLPHLRAHRQPRGSAALPRASPPGERRQHLLREPYRR